jgi:hypothetical protein
MTVSRLLMLTAAALAASTSAGYAGPCSEQIDRMQARVDAMIAATAAAGPTGRESDAALMNRQPSPGSIAAAEERLGEGARAQRALAAMAQARAADQAGDTGACERALADAQRAIGPQ